MSEPTATIAHADNLDPKEILRARARALAQIPKQSQTTEANLETIEFRLAKESYAVEQKFVRECYPLKDLTPVPCDERVFPSFVIETVQNDFPPGTDPGTVNVGFKSTKAWVILVVYVGIREKNTFSGMWQWRMPTPENEHDSKGDSLTQKKEPVHLSPSVNSPENSQTGTIVKEDDKLSEPVALDALPASDETFDERLEREAMQEEGM